MDTNITTDKAVNAYCKVCKEFGGDENGELCQCEMLRMFKELLKRK